MDNAEEGRQVQKAMESSMEDSYAGQLDSAIKLSLVSDDGDQFPQVADSEDLEVDKAIRLS
jgi:hypothetical protein